MQLLIFLFPPNRVPPIQILGSYIHGMGAYPNMPSGGNLTLTLTPTLTIVFRINDRLTNCNGKYMQGTISI